MPGGPSDGEDDAEKPSPHIRLGDSKLYPLVTLGYYHGLR
jgi:hypothetical protein